MVEGRVQRRLAAILAADVAGYSRLMGADESATLAALREVWTERFNPTVAAHAGRIVKMMGDGALVEFASVVDAVECAVAFQHGMADHNAARPDRAPIEFRIGVNLGDIIIDGDDIFGDGVNVAARLESQAPRNGILLSDVVHAQIKGKVSVAFIEGGELALKNIATPVRVWRWGGDGTPVETPAKAPPRHGDKPSIAILPFANMSGDPEQEFFADGLVEDIITTLSKLSGLLVIARISSFVYKGRSVDVREVATELGVRYVLEGSVRKAANRIRITAQLIDAESGAHLWAERYDRAIDDIFAVQDEITLVLATEMQVNLTEGEQARLRYTTTSNVEAWTHWVQGLSHFRQPVTKDQFGLARPCWEKALALDSTSAALNGMLGFMHYADARFGWWDDRETALGKARAYADRAFELDPENPDAYSTSSLVLLLGGRYEEAVVDAKRAVELAPGSADVATFASFVLASSGFAEDAVVQIEKAMTLSPNYPANYLGHLVIAYQQSDQPQQAKQAAERLLAARRNFTIESWVNTQFRRDTARLEADIAALRSAGLPIRQT